MFIDPFDEPSPAETVRECLKAAFDDGKAALLPPRMADLLAQLERRDRERRDD